MKKLIIATAILASVTATMIMVASTPATWMVDPEGRFPSWAYLPPDTHPRREFYSSISLLVLCSEMTGIATVLQTGHTNTYYRLGVLDPEEYEDDDLKTNIFALLQVEDAFYGCTNQQIIMVDYSVFHAPPPLYPSGLRSWCAQTHFTLGVSAIGALTPKHESGILWKISHVGHRQEPGSLNTKNAGGFL